jgi:hypothetical protein
MAERLTGSASAQDVGSLDLLASDAVGERCHVPEVFHMRKMMFQDCAREILDFGEPSRLPPERIEGNGCGFDP